MILTRDAVEALAPDRGALAAAANLLNSSKWSIRARAGDIVWGECQGSGANPYRVAADLTDGVVKCTCPSRKFPCKHGLALMLMSAQSAPGFVEAAIPDWVTEWQGRRRNGVAPKPSLDTLAPSIDPPEAPALLDPEAEAEAKKRAAAAKRTLETRRAAGASTEELDAWIADQLAGLPAFLADLPARCRRIAARMVDGKAAALASRIDEMPSRLLPLLPRERIDAAIAELGKLVLLVRAWRGDPANAELRREVIAAETRDELLSDPAAPRATAHWEALGDRVTTRRDGLVSVSTWLMSLEGAAPRFALLQDFFPASAGRRSGAFVAGECFSAELVFYPAAAPHRAVIAAREPGLATPWPAAPESPLDAHARHLLASPWALETPLLLPAGRIGLDGEGRHWLACDALSLPLAAAAPRVALGVELSAAMGLWNGARLALIAAQSNWGRLAFDG